MLRVTLIWDKAYAAGILCSLPYSFHFSVSLFKELSSPCINYGMKKRDPDMLSKGGAKWSCIRQTLRTGRLAGLLCCQSPVVQKRGKVSRAGGSTSCGSSHHLCSCHQLLEWLISGFSLSWGQFLQSTWLKLRDYRGYRLRVVAKCSFMWLYCTVSFVFNTFSGSRFKINSQQHYQLNHMLAYMYK